MKALCALIRRVGEDEVTTILDELAKTITNAKTESGKRNISTNALKTALGDIQPSVAAKGIQKCAPQLLPGIEQEDVLEIKADCMDILSDVLKRFGDLVAGSHQHMVAALMPQLTHKLATVRKRAVACIGACLAGVILPDGLLPPCCAGARR